MALLCLSRNHPLSPSVQPDVKAKTLLISASTALIFMEGQNIGSAETKDQNWHQWRGPEATGASTTADPPVQWSETKNVRWKVKTTGFGTSTPIIWGEKIFLLSAVKKAQKTEAKSENAAAAPGGPPRSEKPSDTYAFVVSCLDRTTGKTLWEKIVREEIPHEGHHRDHGFASASPVTDGEHLIAYFGSRGLYCLDFSGKVLWEKDFGNMTTRNGFGEGASPALHGNTVIVNWDHEGDDDFIAAFDKVTGKELWRNKRQEPTGWSTPLIVDFKGGQQVIVSATGRSRSYDLLTGKQIWECAGQTVNAIPSPVTDGKTVYLMSGFRGSNLQAIKLGGEGDLSGGSSILWSHNKSTPYVPSPLLVDQRLYFLANNNGILSVWDAGTGKAYIDAERLEGISGVYASPVSAKSKVYICGREGSTLVLKDGPKLEILASNRLDEKIDASPALVGGELFIRGHEHLYSLKEMP